MKRIASLRIPLIAGFLLAGCPADGVLADVVQVRRDIRQDVNVVDGVNLGGVRGITGDVDGDPLTPDLPFEIDNGSPELNLLITIDDSADTGAIFETTLALAGTLADNGEQQVWIAQGGTAVFRDDVPDDPLSETDPTRLTDLMFTVGPITQVSGPSAMITFDGFSTVIANQLQGLSNGEDPPVVPESFTFAGETFVAALGVNSQAFALDPALSPSGSVMTAITSEQFRFREIDLQFTVIGESPPGDFNNNGAAEADDYAIWRDSVDGTTALPNDDGLGTPIGAAHYDLWASNFDSNNPPQAVASAAAVPEPATWLLFAATLCPLFASRRGSVGCERGDC